MASAEVVLGLDPGLAALGYGLVQSTQDGIRYLTHGCITTPANLPLPQRLQALFQQLREVRLQYPVRSVAMESTFYGPRVRAVRVGEARGVALLAAVTEGAHFFEYTPTQVKEAVTGSGRAAKRQVQEMVRLVLGLPAVPAPDDAADALAVAVCHARQLDLQGLLGQGAQRGLPG